MTPSDLRQNIIQYSIDNTCTLLEATVAMADKFEIDLEDIAKHVSGSLKEMMQLECEKDGSIRKDNNSSYIFQ